MGEGGILHKVHIVVPFAGVLEHVHWEVALGFRSTFKAKRGFQKPVATLANPRAPWLRNR